MHEMSLVEAMMDQARDALSSSGHGGLHVAKVELVIGVLSGASPEAMRFAFEALGIDTEFQGAELIIHEPGAICICSDCDMKSSISEMMFCCPECSSPLVTVEGGRELTLQRLEIDEALEE